MHKINFAIAVDKFSKMMGILYTFKFNYLKVNILVYIKIKYIFHTKIKYVRGFVKKNQIDMHKLKVATRVDEP